MKKAEHFTHEDTDMMEGSCGDLVRLPLQLLFARTPHLRGSDVVAKRARLRDYFVSTFIATNLCLPVWNRISQ